MVPVGEKAFGREGVAGIIDHRQAVGRDLHQAQYERDTKGGNARCDDRISACPIASAKGDVNAKRGDQEKRRLCRGHRIERQRPPGDRVKYHHVPAGVEIAPGECRPDTGGRAPDAATAIARWRERTSPQAPWPAGHCAGPARATARLATSRRIPIHCPINCVIGNRLLPPPVISSANMATNQKPVRSVANRSLVPLSASPAAKDADAPIFIEKPCAACFWHLHGWRSIDYETSRVRFSIAYQSGRCRRLRLCCTMRIGSAYHGAPRAIKASQHSYLGIDSRSLRNSYRAEGVRYRASHG